MTIPVLIIQCDSKIEGASRFTLHASRARGFSLIEILVTVALIALFLVPLMRIFGAGMAVNLEAETRSIASGLAQGKMEEIRWTFFSYVAAEPRAKVAYPGFGLFYRQVVLNPQEDTNLKNVSVIVSWAVGSKDRTIEYRTLCADIP